MYQKGDFSCRGVRRRQILAAVAVLFCCLAFGGPGGQAFGASFPDGLYRIDGSYYYYEGGKQVKGQWRYLAEGGRRHWYYFLDSGKACTTMLHYKGNYCVFGQDARMVVGDGRKVVKVGAYYYLPDSSGILKRSQYVTYAGKLYYATQDGHMMQEGTMDGITFQNGVAKKSTSTTSKIKCLETLETLTNKGQTKQEKLRACWDYLVGQSFSYLLRPDADRDDPEWMKAKATDMLSLHAGDCVSYACAFAGLASAIGYDPIVIYGRVPGYVDHAPDGFTTHAWVFIDDRFYDPEGEPGGWNKGVFGLSAYPFPFQVHAYYRYETGEVLSMHAPGET